MQHANHTGKGKAALQSSVQLMMKHIKQESPELSSSQSANEIETSKTFGQNYLQIRGDLHSRKQVHLDPAAYKHQLQYTVNSTQHTKQNNTLGDQIPSNEKQNIKPNKQNTPNTHHNHQHGKTAPPPHPAQAPAHQSLQDSALRQELGSFLRITSLTTLTPRFSLETQTCFVLSWQF